MLWPKNFAEISFQANKTVMLIVKAIAFVWLLYVTFYFIQTLQRIKLDKKNKKNLRFDGFKEKKNVLADSVLQLMSLI